MSDELEDQLLELRRLKALESEAKTKYEEARNDHKSFEAELIDRMAAGKIESQSVDGTRFTPTSTIYSSVQDRQAFVAWAKETDDSLIEDKERKEVLNQIVRQCLDDGDELPPGIGFYTREYISQRAS